MKIHKIDFTPLNRNLYIHSGDKKDNVAPNLNYETFAYRDYNITFSGKESNRRLFRSPSNFYATPFNKKGMPVTMKNYLDEDYEDRRNMPPIQMWKTVFGKINNAVNIEDVKSLYPDEPLFKNLKNNPNKARVSLISQIQTLESEFVHTPLFKDGTSDLGMYLLRKIYMEGKQISEINKDFKKDVNQEYKSLIDKDIDYGTTSAYGIKFPNLAFWNSFVVTRDDFPYEYKPRKASGMVSSSKKKQLTLSDIKNSVNKDNRDRKFKPSDSEIKMLTDAALDKNPKRALSKIRHKSGRNSEQATFIEKYFGSIMTVALEKINASDEMRDFFQNPEHISKNSKERMENYWKQNPYMRKMQSLAMSDTIKLFFEAYGADGNNEVFKDLLRYAASIKPQREAMRAQHGKIQRELEDALAVYDTTEPENADNTLHKSAEEILNEEVKANNAELYEFQTEKGKVVICSNLRETLAEMLEKQTRIMPKSFARAYINYMMSNPVITDSYILTTALKDLNLSLPKDDRLMDLAEAETITIKAFTDFSQKNSKSTNAAQQALIDVLVDFSPEDVSTKLYTLGVFEIPDIISGLNENAQKAIFAKSDEINKRYSYYKKDLSDAEINKSVIAINDLLSKYKPELTIIGSGSPFSEFPVLFSTVSQNIKNHKNAKDVLKKELRNYLPKYGGTARIFIDKNVPDRVKMAKLEQFLCHFNNEAGSLYKYAVLDRNVLDNYVRFHSFELYKFLMTQVLAEVDFDIKY